jgi:hypothetical protein
MRGIRPPKDSSSEPMDLDESKRPGVLTIASQFLLLLFTIVCGIMGLYWLTTDSSGEYFGNTPELGSINLSIIRRATSYDGELTIGNRSTFKLAKSDIHGPNMALEFHSKLPGSVDALFFKGQLKDDRLAGILQLPQSSINLSLMRDPLASLFRQLQSHIPYVTITSPSNSTAPRGTAFHGYFDYILNTSWPKAHPSGKRKQ